MYLSETIHSVLNLYSLTIKSIELLSFRKISSHLFSREFHTISKITIERERVFDVASSSQMPFWFCPLSHSVHHFSNECMSKIEFFKFISFESLLVQLWNFSCISAIFFFVIFSEYMIFTLENIPWKICYSMRSFSTETQNQSYCICVKNFANRKS